MQKRKGRIKKHRDIAGDHYEVLLCLEQASNDAIGTPTARQKRKRKNKTSANWRSLSVILF